MRYNPRHTENRDKGWSARDSRPKSHVWRKVRNRILKRDRFCRVCRWDDMLVVATEVDHVVPLFKGGDALDEDNLQPLCKSCHRRKTNDELMRNPKEYGDDGYPLNPKKGWIPDASS